MLVLNYGMVLQDIMICSGNGSYDSILGIDTMAIANIYRTNKKHQIFEGERERTILYLMLSGF